MKKPTLPPGLRQGSAPHIFRWMPSPALKTLGFTRAVTLKHPSGQHMSMGEAIDAALAINAMIDNWRSGIPARGAWAHLAPKGGTVPVRPGPDLSIGGRLDAFMASESFAALKPSTRKDYACRLNRFVETLAGFANGHPRHQDLPPKAMAQAIARYEAAVQEVKSMPVTELLAEDMPLQTAYNHLARTINPRTGQPATHNANAVITYASGFISWMIEDRDTARLITWNPAFKVKRKASPGRVVVWHDDEIETLLATARRLGWHSIAFAVELALELSWDQQSIRNLTWGQIVNGRVRGTRAKTGNFTHTSLTRAGLALIERIRAHYHSVWGDNVEPSPDTAVITVDDVPGRYSHGAVGLPWSADYFQHTFVAIRNACEPKLTKRFQDLRDTAITRMKEKGLNEHQIQSRSQHSLSQLRNIIDKHYGMTTLEISDQAAALLNRAPDAR